MAHILVAEMPHEFQMGSRCLQKMRFQEQSPLGCLLCCQLLHFGMDADCCRPATYLQLTTEHAHLHADLLE